MPFIGNTPSAVPLTSADIADGIIVNADISSTAGITLNKISGNPNFRNIVINGDMQIAQRSTSVASITTEGYYTVDRWLTAIAGALGTWTQSQSTDVPTGQGFASSLKMDCTTADASPAAGDILILRTKFEGQNLQYLKKGTANALPLTASFWVKSTKTGTFICELQDVNNTRQVSAAYTVSVTNTWEKKTITFPADTTGTLTNNNGASLNLNFWLGAGSDFTSGTLNTTWASSTSANRAVGQVNIADSTSNDWYITGVQLEAGTSATDFEFLPIDVSLGRCERYARIYTNSDSVFQRHVSGWAISTTAADISFPFRITMRTTPSMSVNTIGNLNLSDGAAAAAATSFTINSNQSSVNAAIASIASSGLTQFRPYFFEGNGTLNSAKITFSSEL